VAKAEETRARILDVAQRLVLAQGFTGTSIDQIVDEADLTKGGFFYHFKGKSDLARALMRRYLDEDDAFFRGLIGRAEELVEDPLQRVLLFLKLYAEAMAKVREVHPGCLVASFTYESQFIDPEIRKLTADGVIGWRTLFLEFFEKAAAAHPPANAVRLEVLADMLTCVTEGAIVTGRTLQDPELLPAQIDEFRRYVKLLFES